MNTRKHINRKYNNYKKAQLYKLRFKQNLFLSALSLIIILSISLFINSFSTKASDNDNIMAYKYYKSIEIKKGDTLWSIANEYMDDEHYKNKSEYIKEVKQINSLKSDKIVSGRHIIVPYYSYEFLCSAN